MPREIRADYDTNLLFPPSIEEWVPEDHPARFIREIVEFMDLAELGFKSRECEDGRPNYASDLLLKVWLYGYMENIRSTRKLEKACREHMSLIWLAGNNAPDHNTLWRFFRDNRDALKRVFKRVVKVALDAGLLGMALHAVDGTKIKARVSKDKVLSRRDTEKLLKKLDASVGRMMSEVEKNEKFETGGYRLPEELSGREKLRGKLMEALGKMDKSGKNFHLPGEPDARMMRAGGKVEPAYNAQAAVDAGSGMVVAEDVTNDENDMHQLTPMLDEVEENTGATADETVADAGYYTADELSKADDRNRSVIVNANPALSDDEFHWTHFTYDESNDCVVCPMGSVLEFNCMDNSEKEARREYKCKNFRTCERCHECSTNKRLGRRIRIGPHHAVLMKNAVKLRDEKFRKLLSRRKCTVEPAFGVIKECMGFRRFSFGGLENVKAQWALVCTALNLKKLYAYWARKELGLVLA